MRRTTVILILALAACSESPAELEDGTEAMVARLDSIARNIDPLANRFASRIRAEYIGRIPVPVEPRALMDYRGMLAEELLNAGDTEDAIEVLSSMIEDIDSGRIELPASYVREVLDLTALAYLRLGEQQNCLSNHTSDSCLFPIRDAGIHRITEGSEKAIDVYQRILREWGDDMEARWLLNIAYMTLGRHPDSVPAQWLIPAEAFETEHEMQRFPDIAPQAGLANELARSGGSITEDFTGNGYIDIMTSGWWLDEQIQYFENRGDGTFVNRTDEAGLTGIVGGLNLIHADFTNNGYPDVFVLRGAWLGEAGRHPNSLLRNNGDGTFSDVTESAGLLSYHPTQTAVWADFNNNGWLDLYIGNETSDAGYHPAELYLNNGDGTFRNVAGLSGAAVEGFIKGVTAGDYNNDGLQDIYVSRLGSPNILLRNDGPDDDGVPRFSDVTAGAGVQEPVWSFPTWFWDYNNNGLLDIFVSSYDATPADVANEYLGQPSGAGTPRLYRNNGDGTFADVTREAALDKVMYTMGTNFGDLNNDGYPDFFVGTGDPDFRSLMPNRMFRNIRGEIFEEVTTSGGFGHLQKGHGVSFADMNNNGHQDIFKNMGGALEGDVYMNALFHNPGNDNRWITLLFEGENSNRFGVGNRISVEVETPEGSRTIHKVVSTGGSFGSSSLQQEIGLGDAVRINSIEVFWPAGGETQIFHELDMNRFYLVREREGQLKEIERTPFSFIPQMSLSESHEHHR